MKKQTKASLKRKLDKIFSEVIRKRGYCERCGESTHSKLQCSHIHSRDKLSVRWDLKNAFCLCGGCHIFWWHKNPVLAAEFSREKLGEYEYVALLHRANSIKKWTIPEMQELLKTLEKL